MKMNKIKTYINRSYRKLRIWYLRNTDPIHYSTKVKRPKNCSEDVAAAIRIWNYVIHSKNATLMFDPITYESLVEFNDSSVIYLFLEKNRLRIINTVTGYDVSLTDAERLWCEQNFKRELHIRRLRFKKQSLNKIVNTLSNLEKKVMEPEIAVAEDVEWPF